MSDEIPTASVVPMPQQPAIVKDNSQTAAAMIYGGDAQQYYCSLPSDYPDREAVLMKCSFAPDAKLSDNIGKVISVKHIYGTRVQLANAVTGEVDEVVHTCLIDTTDQVWACTSKGIARSVAMLMGSKGTPDTWKEPIKVLVTGVAAKIGKMLVLKVLPSDTPRRAKV